MIIRDAALADLGAITEIYNHEALTSTVTFDTEPKTEAEQHAWFAAHGPRHPVLVAEMEETVAGWASLSKWSDRCAYADTAEISLYVREGFRGRGVGRALLMAALARGEQADLHTLIARIAEGNAASIRLLESAGFEQVGVMREVGRKFGRWLDVIVMQRMYGGHVKSVKSTPPAPRTPGSARGELYVAPDFDAPLPDDVLRLIPRA